MYRHPQPCANSNYIFFSFISPSNTHSCHHMRSEVTTKPLVTRQSSNDRLETAIDKTEEIVSDTDAGPPLPPRPPITRQRFTLSMETGWCNSFVRNISSQVFRWRKDAMHSIEEDSLIKSSSNRQNSAYPFGHITLDWGICFVRTRHWTVFPLRWHGAKYARQYLCTPRLRVLRVHYTRTPKSPMGHSIGFSDFVSSIVMHLKSVDENLRLTEGVCAYRVRVLAKVKSLC